MATSQRWIALFWDPRKNLQKDIREYTLYGGGEGDPSDEANIIHTIIKDQIPPLGQVKMTKEQEELWFKQLGVCDYDFGALDIAMGARGYLHVFWLSDEEVGKRERPEGETSHDWVAFEIWANENGVGQAREQWFPLWNLWCRATDCCYESMETEARLQGEREATLKNP